MRSPRRTRSLSSGSRPNSCGSSEIASQAELAPHANERVNLVLRRQFVRGHEARDGFRVDDAVSALRPVGVFDQARGLHFLQVMRERRPEIRRSEEHTSELQSLAYLVCRLLLEKKKKNQSRTHRTR